MAHGPDTCEHLDVTEHAPGDFSCNDCGATDLTYDDLDGMGDEGDSPDLGGVDDGCPDCGDDLTETESFAYCEACGWIED